MNSGLALVLALLAAAVAMFALNRPRMDVVAVIMMVALPLFGIIGVKDALAVLGILYMLVARRWLPGKAQQAPGAHARRHLGESIEEYALAGREHRLRVTPSSAAS